MPKTSSKLKAGKNAELSLKRKDEEGISLLTLNRPSAHNSLNLELLHLLQKELEEIAKDTSVSTVIISGEGKSFCSGHDLLELRKMSSVSEYKSIFSLCSNIMQRINELPQPVIAQVNGIATAAGCQLVATCDLAIASDKAQFCTPGVNIGLFCSTPMVALSRNIPIKKSLEMLLTGEYINSQTALEWGLINQVVSEQNLEKQTKVLAKKISSKSRHTIKTGKKAFYKQLNMNLSDAYAYTSQIMADNMLSQDANEGISSFIEKREPSWNHE